MKSTYNTRKTKIKKSKGKKIQKWISIIQKDQAQRKRVEETEMNNELFT